MKVLIAGDFVPRWRVATQIESGDFQCMDEIKPILGDVDYAIVNFESPVVSHDAKPIAKTGPNLKCSPKALQCIAHVGFDCVTLANNHFRDYGQVGVDDTLQACEQYNLDYVGGGHDEKESKKILYKSIKNKVLAIINVCENEWSIASDTYGGANSMDVVRIARDIKEARAIADYVLVIIHGGIELYNLPTPRMKETYRFLIEQGSDAVVNHHQHCYSGYEVYQGKPIFYGVGNFCFDNEAYRGHAWNEGYMVQIDLEDEVGFTYIPYIQCDKEPRVCLINDKEQINKSIDVLNQIIADEESLRDSYEKIVREHSKLLKRFEPYMRSRFLSKLWRMKLLPDTMDDRRSMMFLNYFRCESYRDILVSLLSQKIKK